MKDLVGSGHGVLTAVTENDRMERGDGPWNANCGRKRARGWTFAGFLAAMMVGLFLLTLNWPTAGPVRFAAAADAAPTPAARGSLVCDVAYITDGDTLRCRDGTRIRLHAIAARESDGTCSPGHPCPSASGAAATAELRRLASGKTITCEPTGQSYNRTTAICWTPAGEEINCAMVRSGVALLWDRFDRETPLCRR